MPGPNRSTAVMQRRIEPPDSLEYFPTPPWANRAVCELLQAEYGEPLELQRAWEPCCGELHMVRPMREYFAQVHATDVHRYSLDHGIFDFLDLGAQAPVLDVDWIFLNPPFVPARRFIERARRVARRGVAVFARSAFHRIRRPLRTAVLARATASPRCNILRASSAPQGKAGRAE